MRSRRTPEFKAQMRALPVEVRRQAHKAYRQFKIDPYHPGLQFKRVSSKSPIYSARIGISFRTLGRMVEPDLIVWFWIGTHADYDKILRG